MRHVSRPRPDPARRSRSTQARGVWVPPPVNGYAAEILSPEIGHRTQDRTPEILVQGTSILGEPVDLQVQFAQQRSRDGVMTNPQTAEILAAGSGTAQSVVPPNDLEFTTWWVRARAGLAANNVWSAWTPDQWFDVLPVLGSISGYADLNIGVGAPAALGAAAYLDLNVGVEAPPPLDAVAVVDLNVGVVDLVLAVLRYVDLNLSPLQVLDPAAVRYLDLTVLVGRPVPVIWWIRPEQGREGFVFNIYGHGFGAFQNEYDGQVLLGDLVAPINRWERVAEIDPGPDGHRIVRAADPVDDEITPEHGWIVAVVPEDAVSAPVKIVLRSE